MKKVFFLCENPGNNDIWYKYRYGGFEKGKQVYWFWRSFGFMPFCDPFSIQHIFSSPTHSQRITFTPSLIIFLYANVCSLSELNNR